MENNITFESHLLPNGAKVTFYADTHTYFVDERQVPSITTLVSNYYGDTYGAVNPELLKHAADYGTAVHEDLQQWINIRKATPGATVISGYPEVNNYFTYIEDIYKIIPVATEKVVVLFGPNGTPVAAGRFDLLCTVDNQLTLCDFKTTSTVHRNLVTAQLNLYLRAARQSGYVSDQQDVKLGVIHLNGSKAKYVPISVIGDEFYLKLLQASDII